MCVAPNAMTRGLNAIHAQVRGITPEHVKPFYFFCVSFCEMVHAYHQLEETYVFGVYESKLGAGAMAHNVEQHHSSMAGARRARGVRQGRARGGGTVWQRRHAHRKDGGVHGSAGGASYQQIPMLDKERMRAAFTKQDFKDMEAGIVKHVFKDMSLWTTLPMGLLCHEKTTAPYDAWAFAPCDIFGNLKLGLGNEPGESQV
ncbi:hypothetical protein DFH09DRAFT_1074678 [Mycena vulgaris]|nr:hypothetical protein DFH09DRAFT_1074678 [Mycena vulgaris]